MWNNIVHSYMSFTITFACKWSNKGGAKINNECGGKDNGVSPVICVQMG